MEDWREELEEILEEETDTGRNMIPKYARCYARIILENFISQEIEKAREQERKRILEEVREEFSEFGVPPAFMISVVFISPISYPISYYLKRHFLLFIIHDNKMKHENRYFYVYGHSQSLQTYKNHLRFLYLYSYYVQLFLPNSRQL